MTGPKKTDPLNISPPSQVPENKSNREKRQDQEDFFRHRFHQIFENVNDGIIIHDTEGHICDVNSSMYKRLGYTKEEMLAMNIKDLVPPEYGKKVAERTLRLEKNGSAVFESADLRKDGRPMPVEVSARLILENGKPLIQSIVRDITDRKTAEDLISATMIDRQNALDDMRACGKLITDLLTRLLIPSPGLSDSEQLKLARQHMNTLNFIQKILLETARPFAISSRRLIRKLLIHLSKKYWNRMASVSLHSKITEKQISSFNSLRLGMLLSEMFVLALDKIPPKEPVQIIVIFDCPESSKGKISLDIKGTDSSSQVTLIRKNGPEQEHPFMPAGLLHLPAIRIKPDSIEAQIDL